MVGVVFISANPLKMGVHVWRHSLWTERQANACHNALFQNGVSIQVYSYVQYVEARGL